MKSYTDLEQSKKLAEILPVESADMYYKYVLPKSDKIIHTPEIGNPINSLKWYNEGYTFRGKREPITLSEYCIPCWSLAALLDVLRKVVGYEVLCLDRKNTTIKCELGDEPWGIEINKDNEVDACYEMIIYLNELKLL